MFKKLTVLLSTLFFLSCTSVAPSPLLSHWALDANSEVAQIVLKCLDGPNYTPEAEGCDEDLLKEKGEEIIALAEDLIEADTIQSQGFDFYLHSSMIVLRVNARECTRLEETRKKCEKQLKRYSLVEKVAEQFFQTEKEYDSESIDKARFWRLYYVTANVALKNRLKILNPEPPRFLYLMQVLRDGEENDVDLTAGYRIIYREQLSDLGRIVKTLR
ncbi:MAG: hypothetical protein GF334_04730 [Candidatus Altiarchaeales archaeon]|nr:hypothetical protein [Candidatus Altiarchaeales archaeon]